MRRLTMLALALALLGGVAGCGGGKTQSAWLKESKRVRASVCRSEVFNTPRCGEAMQKVCEAAIGTGPHEPEGRNATCKLAAIIRTQVKKNKEASGASTQHTPEEEAAHNKSLETQRRGEEQETDAQKKVEEDENRGGEHSIRRTEEKVCYESGKSAQECVGPLKETPQEERSEAENKARQQQGQEESTGQPAVVE